MCKQGKSIRILCKSTQSLGCPSFRWEVSGSLCPLSPFCLGCYCLSWVSELKEAQDTIALVVMGELKSVWLPKWILLTVCGKVPGFKVPGLKGGDTQRLAVNLFLWIMSSITSICSLKRVFPWKGRSSSQAIVSRRRAEALNHEWCLIIIAEAIVWLHAYATPCDALSSCILNVITSACTIFACFFLSSGSASMYQDICTHK